MDEIKDRLTFSQIGDVCKWIKKAGDDLSLPEVWSYVIIASVIKASGVVMTKEWAQAQIKKTEVYA